jgi:hypothetical protein
VIPRRKKFSNDKGECLRICGICQVRYSSQEEDDLHRHEEDPRSTYYPRDESVRFDYFALWDPITEPIIGRPGEGWDYSCLLGGSGNSIMIYDPPWIDEDGKYINVPDWDQPPASPDVYTPTEKT